MRALITGITGQDGSYMAELLLSKGYDVYGLVRHTSTCNLERIRHIKDSIRFISGDLSDTNSIASAIKESRPDEIYNLGAMSFVPDSWKYPELTFNVNCLGLLRIIENSDCKVYQASTSEMYGNSYPNFNPVSPYGISKLSAHNLVGAYRSKGRYICSGICFNHESPRRGNEFVTKKIANFFKDKNGRLKLGNLDASRDWGFAGDYVYAMWLMMQQNVPDDYEIATGETHTIREFLELTDPDWESYVDVDPSLIRANEVHVLKGDPFRMKSIGWKQTVDFKGLVEMMNG